MSLLKTSLVPFRANPQSCPYIYWGLWASWWLGGLFPCCGNSMKYPNVIVCLRQLISGEPNAIALCHCSVLVLICSCHSFVFFPCFLLCIDCCWLYYVVLWVCLPNRCMQPSLCHFPRQVFDIFISCFAGRLLKVFGSCDYVCGDVRTLAHVMSLTAGTLQSRYIRILQDCPRFHTSQILLGNSKL